MTDDTPQFIQTYGSNGVDGECAISIPRSLAMKLKLRIYA